MSLAYRLLYAVGYTPWEQPARLPAVRRHVGELFAREEDGREAPYGLALDLGCGSGIWGVELARRGWQVTGVDFVPKALRRAHERAREAGVEIRLVEGDVTDLRATGIARGYQLLVDFFLFHDELTDEQRLAMGREVTAVAAPGATLLMTAWAPGRRGPLPRGASRRDIEIAFPKWTVIAEEPFDVVSGARFYKHIRKAQPRVYRLHLEPDAGTDGGHIRPRGAQVAFLPCRQASARPPWYSISSRSSGRIWGRRRWPTSWGSRSRPRTRCWES
jgi:SAM-dependent methyltransferase